MAEAIFKATPRARAGKGANRVMREQGQVPGVIYGGGEPPELIALSIPDFIKEHESGKMTSRISFVDVGGKKTRVVAREVQVDPVRDHPIHIDFTVCPRAPACR
ncbi:MAG: hypothetical protein U1E87_04340 [Alphaproteobacteria bacterium]